MAPGRWLHAITIIYPGAGCWGVSSAGLFPALWSFQDLIDRCSAPQSFCEAPRVQTCCWVWPNFVLFVCRSLSPAKLASLPPLWWQLRGDEWHSSFSLSVCPSPPVSLCQSFQWLPAQICQADGGPAFYMSLEGRPGNTICGPTMQCFWTLFEKPRTENRCDAMRGPDSSEESLCILPVCVYLLPGSFRRTLHLLFIPWNKAGPWREHRLHTQTHSLTHTHTNGPPSVAEKSAIMEREGRDSWDLHMSLREETTSPTRPGGGNEPAVHGL